MTDPFFDTLLRAEQVPDRADVVIVGAGAAGCVVAARLSEDPDRSVLLLEAGSAVPNKATSIPGTAFHTLGDDERFYRNRTVPQPKLGGRSVELPTGRGLGGSSSVNLLAWFQGHPADYDAWAASGATGWNWSAVAPVFGAIENHASGPGRDRAVGGPVSVGPALDLEPAQTAFVGACRANGIEVTRDFNGTQRTGAGLVDANVRDGVRDDVVEAYLRPASGRDNLRIALDTPVRRAVLDGGRAVGVELSDGRQVAAERVVLTAGALRTPQLLMLSGIGPADHLREHGLEVELDSPGVGENLQDHPMVPLLWSVVAGRTLLDAQDESSRTAYELLRRGPLSAAPTTGAMLTLPGEGAAASIQALFYLVGIAGGTALPEPGASVTTALLTPYSRGRVTLRSADPAESPVIDPAYLSDERDLARFRAGVSRVREAMAATPAQATYGAPIAPGAQVSGAMLDDWIRENLTTQWHPVGTARMGTDPLSPVGPNLAVRGVSALSVADASIMPLVTRGNTHAPAVMIAERAARFILRETSRPISF